MEESRKCAYCQFYCKNHKGLMVCEDYDGLYFQCEMQATERCPDFIRKDSVDAKTGNSI